MKFVAIDVETANADLASICQIGIAKFHDSLPVETSGWFVNPEDDFDPVNIAIHGITNDKVRHEPTLPNLFNKLQESLNAEIVVCHTGFDRLSLARAAEKYKLPVLNCNWLDSAKVARRAWSACARSGYGLGNLAKSLGIVFKHHDAREDARAAGEIVLRAVAETGRTLSDWLVRVRQPIFAESEQIARDGNPEGPLAGEVLVFTGTLSIPRGEAAEIAAGTGCTVAESVNKTTTLLVVGNQDVRKLAGHEKSSKQRKAETLIAKGLSIRVLTEDDFRRLLHMERVE
ncbi:MAG: transposase [Planctomycetes bacterium]|nr:transposase [Planctomycetota bacterium]MBI3833222.1 transposase [Planctomycetota bacterium]